MKSIITSFVLVGCCVPIAMGATQIISEMNAPASKHEFANLNSPLWSNTPIKIDREHQSYERLPALLTANTQEPARKRVAVIAQAGQAVAEPKPQSVQIEQARISWCQQRYSSYRVTDNTYQPFGGGLRRACEAPAPSFGETVAEAPVHQGADGGNIAHVRWCSSHYASYEPADNSYRAFSGARRQCTSPFTGTGSNTLQASM